MDEMSPVVPAVISEPENPPVVVRRNRPGSKRSEWCNWPDQTFAEMESIHAAQMLIQVLF